MEKTQIKTQGTLLLEVSLFVVIVILDGIGIVPISQTIFLIPFIWIALRLKGEKFKSIGFTLGGQPFLKTLLIGTILGIALEVLATYVTTPLISTFFGVEPDLSELSEITGNLTMLMVYLAISWILGAFGEEICFRGFLMNRLSSLFGGTKTAWVLSIVLSSILFGVGHTEQGISGWVQEGLSGLFLAIIFIRSNKQLAIPIIAHGVSNTVALIMIYLGQYPGA